MESDTSHSFPVELPWRAFKAFTQLYDLESGLRPMPNQRLLLFSDSRAGERLRAGLLDKQLIIPSVEYQVPYRVLRGRPLGREPIEGVPAAPLVRPVNRSLQGMAWNRTDGRCAFCGTCLTWFERPNTPVLTIPDDLSPLLSCRSCHALRGDRSLEEMRYLMGMRRFENRYGVRFTRRQLAFLEKRGLELDIPRTEFWFEKQRRVA